MAAFYYKISITPGYYAYYRVRNSSTRNRGDGGAATATCLPRSAPGGPGLESGGEQHDAEQLMAVLRALHADSADISAVSPAASHRIPTPFWLEILESSAALNTNGFTSS